MKKLIIALVSALMVSAPICTVEAQEDFNIDGEWFAVTEIEEIYGITTKENNGDYRISYDDGGITTISSEKMVYENDDEYETSEYRIGTAQVSDDIFVVYYEMDNSWPKLDGIMIIKSGDDYISYGIESECPMLFTDGNIYLYGIDLYKDNYEDINSMQYKTIDDKLYIFVNNEYVSGKITVDSEDVFEYKTDIFSNGDTQNDTLDDDVSEDDLSRFTVFIRVSAITDKN